MRNLLIFAVVGAGILWLLWRDAKERKSVPPAIWIVVAWAVIYSTRSVTSWFGEPDLTASRDEGNFGEAIIYVLLILAALVVLVWRNTPLSAIIKENSWLFVFYLFWCTSMLWSDFPFITLKRLIKDLGNVAMVVLLLTSAATVPGEAIKAVFIRCAYVCIPLSIAVIRYLPQFGRSYVGYHSDTLMYLGVTGHKNALGMVSAASAVVLLWDLLDALRTWGQRTAVEKVDVAARALVLAMCWYLLRIADSATSLVCAAFGSLLVVGVTLLPWLRRPGALEASAAAGVLTIWSVDALFNLKEAFVRRLGRNMTLTTRTDIWESLLEQQDSPLLGAGFDSFWTGRRAVEAGGSFGGIIQAHNGYLETYLNGGWVGVTLLAIVLGWGYIRVRRALQRGAPEGCIRLVFLLLVIVHNVAEASFNKVSILWFATVLMIMEYRALPDPPPVRAAGHSLGRASSPSVRV